MSFLTQEARAEIYKDSLKDLSQHYGINVEPLRNRRLSKREQASEERRMFLTMEDLSIGLRKNHNSEFYRFKLLMKMKKQGQKKLNGQIGQQEGCQ